MCDPPLSRRIQSLQLVDEQGRYIVCQLVVFLSQPALAAHNGAGDGVQSVAVKVYGDSPL